jgi:hypothetical protein
MATRKKAELEDIAVNENAEEEADDLNALVTVKVPRLPGSENQSMFVGVNGKTWLIQRGKAVKVPKYVALVIQESIDAREAADEKLEKIVSDAEERFARM